MPKHLTEIETALQNIGALEPISKFLAASADFNHYDNLLISFKQLATSNNQLWAFQVAIELQWKQLKHVTSVSDIEDANIQGSPNLLESKFQVDLSNNANNSLIEDLGMMCFVLQLFYSFTTFLSYFFNA